MFSVIARLQKSSGAMTGTPGVHLRLADDALRPVEVINVAVGADRPGDRALTAVRPVQVADQAPDGGAQETILN